MLSVSLLHENVVRVEIDLIHVTAQAAVLGFLRPRIFAGATFALVKKLKKIVGFCNFSKQFIAIALYVTEDNRKSASRLLLLDRKSGFRYFVDTGSVVCTFPRNP